MKFGIVIFPSKQLQDLANSYRKRYDPHYSLITPHLTLLSPFEASEDSIKTGVNQLQQIASKVKPFPLKVTKISSLKPVNNVIYFKVEQVDELKTLNHELNSQFKEPSEYAFVPHITIGQKLSDDEHTDVYSSLRLQQVQHEEIVNRFHLLYQLENGSWTVYETFHLGKE